MASIGFAGLGIMGRPMLNLLKAGPTVIAYDSFTPKLEACVADGAQRAASNREVGERAPIIITMVPEGPQIEEAVLGSNGALEGAKPGSLIINMSSINPFVSQKVGAACAIRFSCACNARLARHHRMKAEVNYKLCSQSLTHVHTSYRVAALWNPKREIR